VEYFNKVKIIEVLAIKNNVINTLNFFNAIDRKANKLIKRYDYISNDYWNNHRVNNYTSNQVLRAFGY